MVTDSRLIYSIRLLASPRKAEVSLPSPFSSRSRMDRLFQSSSIRPKLTVSGLPPTMKLLRSAGLWDARTSLSTSRLKKIRQSAAIVKSRLPQWPSVLPCLLPRTRQNSWARRRRRPKTRPNLTPRKAALRRSKTALMKSVTAWTRCRTISPLKTTWVRQAVSCRPCGLKTRSLKHRSPHSKTLSPTTKK